MSCTPANGVLHAPHSMISIISPSESETTGEVPAQRRGSRAYQIFPESPRMTESESDSICEEMAYRRERLPSIVVEPTEQSEVEGGMLHWALHHNRRGEDEEDSSNENSQEGAPDREQQEDVG
ncbi:protein LBH-like [Aplochiton taeniatus]